MEEDIEEKRYEKCDKCKNMIDIWKENIYVLIKYDDELYFCYTCFSKHKYFYKKDNWYCEDFLDE